MLNLSLLIMRVIVGAIMYAHGAQKLFGLYGGPGLSKFVEAMGGSPIYYLVAIGECLGGIGIILGLLTRFSAASNIVIMIGAIVLKHGANGFFLSAGGYEYNLALIGLLFPLVVLGPGAYALGKFLPLPKHVAFE